MREKWGNGVMSGYELEFVDCINQLELLDLSFSGSFFTWNNKRSEDQFVAHKLDRVIANEDWFLNNCQSALDFQEGGISDHSSVVITVGRIQSFGLKPGLIMLRGILLNHMGRGNGS